MEESTYLCRQCRDVFRLQMPDDSSAVPEVKCPRCGSSNAYVMPTWVPPGFKLSKDVPEWECVCQHCQNFFKLRVPSSPSEEKEIVCPACGSGHVHRLTPSGLEPLYCG